MTCGPFDGRVVFVVAEFEAVIVAERAVGVSSSEGGVSERSMVPGILRRSDVRTTSSLVADPSEERRWRTWAS